MNDPVVNGAVYQLYPIGQVRRTGGEVSVEIAEAFRPALQQLDQFSHVLVFWWAGQHDNPADRQVLQTRPPYAEDKVTGVFACRSEYRPNPIAMTVCEILAVDEKQGIIRLTNIDAYEGSAVVDVKAYFPVCDRVKEARLPAWLPGWPEWLPDEGIGVWE